VLYRGAEEPQVKKATTKVFSGLQSKAARKRRVVSREEKENSYTSAREYSRWYYQSNYGSTSIANGDWQGTEKKDSKCRR